MFVVMEHLGLVLVAMGLQDLGQLVLGLVVMELQDLGQLGLV